jgi:hypothetical protein
MRKVRFLPTAPSTYIPTSASGKLVGLHRAIYPVLALSDWGQSGIQATAGVWWKDGRGAGISVPSGEPLADRVVYLADQFQESEVEALWYAARRCGRTVPGIPIPTR